MYRIDLRGFKNHMNDASGRLKRRREKNFNKKRIGKLIDVCIYVHNILITWASQENQVHFDRSLKDFSPPLL